MARSNAEVAPEPPAPRGIRRLLADPPLLDRLRWREGIYPQTLISEDLGLMARTFGTLFLAGATVGFAILIAGERAGRDELLILAVSLTALTLGAVCFVGYRRLSQRFFAAMLTVGTALITVAAAAAPSEAAGIYGFFYIWVLYLAFLFFSRRMAAAQGLLAGAAFAAVLMAADTPFAGDLLISCFATLGTTGILIGILRSHIEQMAAGLTSEAHTDPVTALTNRRGFDERFQAEVERATRLGRPLSLVICDLDRFKSVNDQLGHEQGDLALRRAADAIVEATRNSDLVARLGGEEFAVVLPDTRADAAFRIAERIRHGLRIEFDGYEVPVTVSCGVASLVVGGDAGELFRAADSALYAAKRGGRNATATAEGLGVSTQLHAVAPPRKLH